MNKELLLRVKAHILEEPRRLNMSQWTQEAKVGSEVHCGFETGMKHCTRTMLEEEAPPCGTVACIAGWAAVLNGSHPDDVWFGSGGIALGLEPRSGDELFYPDEWPNPADFEEYKTCGNAAQRAQIVARVIDAFIAKYEEAAK